MHALHEISVGEIPLLQDDRVTRGLQKLAYYRRKVCIGARPADKERFLRIRIDSVFQRRTP